MIVKIPQGISHLFFFSNSNPFWLDPFLLVCLCLNGSRVLHMKLPVTPPVTVNVPRALSHQRLRGWSRTWYQALYIIPKSHHELELCELGGYSDVWINLKPHLWYTQSLTQPLSWPSLLPTEFRTSFLPIHWRLGLLGLWPVFFPTSSARTSLVVQPLEIRLFLISWIMS